MWWAGYLVLVLLQWGWSSVLWELTNPWFWGSYVAVELGRAIHALVRPQPRPSSPDRALDPPRPALDRTAMDDLLRASLSAAPGAGRALPMAAYLDAGLFGREQRGLFRSDWVFVATVGQLGAPGDFVSTDVGGEPVVVVRTEAGELRALSNVCRHRGTPLTEGCGNERRLRCPYHGWTYSLEGGLQGVPFAERGELDAAAIRLPRFRLETWAGLVFVCLDPGAEPLADRLAALAPYAEAFDLERLAAASPTVDDEEWGANWKLVLANAMESYHLFQVHPRTLEPISPTRSARYLAGSARGTATGGTVAGSGPEPFGQAGYLLLSLPPSLVAVVDRTSLSWLAVSPQGPGRTAVRTGIAWGSGGFGPRGGRGSFRELFAWTSASWGEDFLAEDRAICERGQRAATAELGSGGPLLEIERVVGDFHRYLGWRLLGVEPSEVLISRPAPESTNPSRDDR